MTRRSATTEPLLNLSLEELAKTERSLRKKRSQPATMGDNVDHQQQEDPALPQMRAQVDGLEAQMAQILQLLQQQNAQQQNRGEVIGQAHRPHAFYRNNSAIILPAMTRQDFELKANLIGLAEAQQFSGLAHENPMQHLERIERICGIQKINGVSQDYIKCKLFEFSLSGRAASWLSSLPPNSLDGWVAVRNAFLDHFFTKSKTAELKLKISGFKQLSGETFSEAWERFKGYKRDCPHHGFSDTQLLNTFYEGVQRGHKMALDAASNGNFMTRTVLDGTQLIENLAESSGSSNQEYDRSKPVNLIDSHKISERLELIEKLLKESVHAVEQQEVMYNQEEEVKYVNGQPRQGFNMNFRNHPNFSYRNPNVENPQDQVYTNPAPITNANQGFMPSQGQQGYQGQQMRPPYQQHPPPRNFNNQRPQGAFNIPYQQPPNPLEELKASMNQMIAYQQRAEQKSEERFNSMETRFDSLQAHVKKLDTQVAQNAEAIKRQPGTLPGRTEGNPRHEQIHAIITSSDLSQVTKNSTEKLDTDNSISTVAAEEPRKRRSIFKRAVLRPQDNTPKPNERVYVELPPYPDVDEEEESEPPTLEEDVKTETCKVITTPVVTQPAGDEGPFCLPITIKDTSFPHVICDTGASVNTLPLVTAEKVGFTAKDFMPINFTVSLADSTERKPVGMLEDVEVIIGGVRVPTDFLVMDTGTDDPEFMILGRPFLSSTGAKLDFKERSIDLDFGWKKMRFYPDDVVIRPHAIMMTSISAPSKGAKLLKEIREKCRELVTWKKRNRSKIRPFVQQDIGDPPDLQHSPKG